MLISSFHDLVSILQARGQMLQAEQNKKVLVGWRKILQVVYQVAFINRITFFLLSKSSSRYQGGHLASVGSESVHEFLIDFETRVHKLKVDVISHLNYCRCGLGETMKE